MKPGVEPEKQRIIDIISSLPDEEFINSQAVIEIEVKMLNLDMDVIAENRVTNGFSIVRLNIDSLIESKKSEKDLINSLLARIEVLELMLQEMEKMFAKNQQEVVKE